jgi:hypothetical protein
LIINLCRLVHPYTDLEHESAILKRIEKEFLIGVTNKSQLTDSFFTPLWLQVFDECFKDFPDSYKAQARNECVERHKNATSEKEFCRINEYLTGYIFGNYRFIRENKYYLDYLVEKLEEIRTGLDSRGMPTPIDEFSRFEYMNILEFPSPKLAIQLQGKKIKTNLTNIAAFAEAIDGIDIERLRFCKICKKVFWAVRSDKETCTKECSNTLSQQIRRNEKRELINERRRKNYKYKKDKEKNKNGTV